MDPGKTESKHPGTFEFVKEYRFLNYLAKNVIKIARSGQKTKSFVRIMIEMSAYCELFPCARGQMPHDLSNSK